MSPHIRIDPEPVLTAHTPSPPVADSHCPAREIFSSPLRNRIFDVSLRMTALDASLRMALQRKINRYRQQYADNQNISFLSAIMTTSSRMHGKFLRLFLQVHRETTTHFNDP
jgi:hypothetical protein